MPFAQALVQEAASGLGKPIINGREDHEDDGADEHVMEMGYQEIGVIELPVPRGASQHNAC